MIEGLNLIIMINLEKQQIKKTLPKVKDGLEKYLWLQREVSLRNVSTDREFQKKFNAFYRVRRGGDWQKVFYGLLENSKDKESTFKDILVKFHGEIGRMEASFVSKLIATINPKMPIIDKVVFKNLSLSLPPVGVNNRELLIEERYQSLAKEFSLFLQTENGKYLIDEFIKEYPKANITKVKMLDFILWQIRD